MSRGVTNRTKVTFPRGGSADELARGVNTLPFGYVGFCAGRTTSINVATANTWVAPPLTLVEFDSDKFLNAAGTRAVVPEQCEGLYVIGLIAKATPSAFNIKAKITVNGATVLRHFLSGVPYLYQAPPVLLNVGDRIEWFLQSTSTSEGMRAELADADTQPTPRLFAYRVGLLP